MLALAAFLCAVLLLTFVTLSPISAAAFLLSPLYMTHVMYVLGAAFEKPLPPPEEPPARSGESLPLYTVLVPLYREAAIIGQLARTLQELEYPAALLQIILLLEQDDEETRKALAALPLPPQFEVLIVPAGGPRTKPNALNHGLLAARGSLVTVYDAEDLPDPDQLRRAAAMFGSLPASIACVQARLVIDNAPDGWLALMMSIEYAALFDATKCGFAAMALPVALGGTSNHFRRDVLLAMGGWDEWNVTEDAELGLRLALEGYFVADLPSATLEEAPFSLTPWFSQRRRWLKGFMQTFVSHTRAPVSSIRVMGFIRWTGGLIQIIGTVAGALLFPFFAGHVLWYAIRGDLFDNPDFSTGVLNTLTLWVACCGMMTALFPAIIGLRRRRAWQLAPWLLTLPFYLLLISAAAWFAAVDYVREPFRWLKTEHGLGVRRPEAFRSRRE
jgi:glycosyltransferase XagB